MPCNMAVLEMAGTVLERDELYELKLKIDQHKHLVTSCFVSRTFPNSRLRFGPKSKNLKTARPRRRQRRGRPPQGVVSKGGRVR